MRTSKLKNALKMFIHISTNLSDQHVPTVTMTKCDHFKVFQYTLPKGKHKYTWRVLQLQHNDTKYVNNTRYKEMITSNNFGWDCTVILIKF